MKTISILLVTVLGVAFGKPPTRFPDLLAPFRGIFGSSQRVQQSVPYDSNGIESHGRGPYLGENNGNNIEGVRGFPGQFSNNGFEDGASRNVGQFLGAETRLHHYPPPHRPGYFQPDGRPHSAHFHSDSGHPSQNQLGRPPVQQIDDSPPDQAQRPSMGPSFYPNGNQRQGRHHRLDTMQHLPPIVMHHHHPSNGNDPPHQFPDFSSSRQPKASSSQHQSGFTDFAFNPADFDKGFSTTPSGEERPHLRPTIHNHHPPNRAGSEYQPSFIPSKRIPDFTHGSRSASPEILTMHEIHRGNGGNGGVYFDEIYRQPPTGHNTNRLTHGAIQQGLHRSFANSGEKSTPPHAETQHNKIYVSTGHGDIHYGRPLTPSSSTTSNYRKPIQLVSPTFPTSKPYVHEFEPIPAASGHGNGGAESSNGDRILYHVAGHQGPYSYRFGYDTGAGYNRMFRHEEKDGSGLVKGKYGFYDKTGKLQLVNYSAHPQGGFHAERGH